MGLSRQDRVSIHKKQEFRQLKIGVPSVTELAEGLSTIRITDEGVVEYIRHNNRLYKNIFNNADSVSATQFSDTGYLVLPSGFILQWGQVTASSSNETVTFPIPFPNECLNITCTDYDSSDADGITSATGISTLPTKTKVIFTCFTTVDTFFWQAIGY